MKLMLLAVSIFSFLHIIRDWLQIKGVKNWFTGVGHVWDAPKYEVHGMIIFALIGAISLYFFSLL